MAEALGRIVFVVSSVASGGAERQLLEYLKRAPSSLHISIICLTRPRSENLQAEYEALNMPCIFVDRQQTNLICSFLRIVREIRRRTPNIVHTFLDGSPGSLGRIAALVARVPIILHSSRCIDPPLSRTNRIVSQWLNRKTNHFLTNASATADRYRSRGINEQRITVIPSGVDLSRFHPAARDVYRARWGIPAAATVGGFLGNFRAEKRLDILLQALRALDERKRPDLFLIAGSGPYKAWLHGEIESDAWLRDHVRLTGFADNAPGFLAAIDYLVLSSDIEGCPNVVLEAMAMEKAIVATGVSDVPFILRNIGFVARRSDVQSLAKCIEAVQMLTPEDRRSRGLQARARIEADYDITKVAKRFWRTHIELLPSTTSTT